MRDERIKLIIKNIDLLLRQLKLEFEEDVEPELTEEKSNKSNLISIRDLLMPEDYEEPPYYEEPEKDLPNISVRWRNKNV
ncbi:hypothetical protein b23_0378 [Synechococcus phage B23]|jgi:hypothetical protein|nr:hypothetical protein b23_0378 [Synechococcus phage B23]